MSDNKRLVTAFIMVTVTQRKLGPIGEALKGVPEVLEVYGLSGVTDLLVHIVARDAARWTRDAPVITP